MGYKPKILILVLVAMVAIVGCNKKDDGNACINPQLPGDYFPAFPGSSWKLRNFNNELIHYNISSQYEICEDKCRPRFLNINTCIQDNSLIHVFYAGLGTNARVASPIYSLQISDTLICPISFSTFKTSPSMGPPVEDISFRRVLIKQDTNLIVNNVKYDNVILVKEYSLHDSLHMYIDYFAKDIGLIKRDSIIKIDTTIEFETILTLEEYHIEN